MNTNDIKEIDEIYDAATEMENLLRVISNRHRIMIICRLMQEDEINVTELNKGIQITQSALSQHLAVLRRANLVNTRRASQVIYYSISDDKLKEMMPVLTSIFHCTMPQPK